VTVALKTSFIVEESLTAYMKVGHCHVLRGGRVWSHDSCYIVVVQCDCKSRPECDGRQETCSLLHNTKHSFHCHMKVRSLLFWIQISG